MKESISEHILSFLRERKRFRRWEKALLALACVVVFITTYALILPVLTKEGKAYCGKEEHTHSEQCYEGDVLICEQEEHTHSAICYSNPEADVETEEDWKKTVPSGGETGYADTLLTVAKSQLGYQESADNYSVEEQGEDQIQMGYTRYGAWYGSPYASWNALFVDFCLQYADISELEICRGETASEWMTLVGTQLQSPKDYTPAEGDIVFFQTGEDGTVRVGIVETVKEGKKETGTIVVIEGDTKNGDDPDVVAEKAYSLDDSSIAGYICVPQKEETNTITVENPSATAAAWTKTAGSTRKGASSTTDEVKTSGTAGKNITWTVGEDKVLTISGTGEMTDWSSAKEEPWYDCINQGLFDKVVVEEGVTSIGDYAFYTDYALSSVTLPKSLKSIGAYAFYNVSALSSVTIPEGVTTIGTNAFERCANLKTLTIPKTVTTIGTNAFFYMPTDLTINWNVSKLSSTEDIFTFYKWADDMMQKRPLEGTVTFGTDVKTLSHDLLSDLNGCVYNTYASYEEPLQAAFLGPNLFTYTGEAYSSVNGISMTEGTYYADAQGILYKLEDNGQADLARVPESFSGELSINSTIQAGGKEYTVTSILANALDGCKKITAVSIPDTVTSIGAYAFRDCRKITQITIPQSVASIGKYAFNRCQKLGSVNGLTERDAVMKALNTTDQSIFLSTALTENQTAGGNVVTTSLVYKKEKSYQVSVTTTADSDYYKSGSMKLLTGESANISIHLDEVSDNIQDTIYVYFRFEGANPPVTEDTVFGHQLDVKQEFTDSSSGKVTYVKFHKKEDDLGTYYSMEFVDVKAGDTSSVDLSTTYENYTSSGGKMSVWLEKDGNMNQVTWHTKQDAFTLTESAYEESNIAVKGDGVQQNPVTVRNLKFEVEMKKEESDASSAYGKDVVKETVYSSKLVLPKEFSWRDEVIDAIQNGNWYVRMNTIYVTLSENGKDVLYSLADVSIWGDDASAGNIKDLGVAVSDQGEVLIEWSFCNTEEKKEISLPTYRISYGPKVIVADTAAIAKQVAAAAAAGGADPVYTFTNQTEVEKYYTYGASSVSSSSAEAKKSIGGADFTMKKTPEKAYRLPTVSMGSALKFAIILTNSGTLPYESLTEVNDALPYWYYIKPADMETMFADVYGKELTITIKNAGLCTSLEKKITRADGEKYTVRQDLAGEHGADSYPTTTASPKDLCHITYNASITIRWAKDQSCLELTLNNDTNKTTTYTVGEGKDYPNLETALNQLGYVVERWTTYTLQWNQKDVSLWSGEERTFSIPATCKSSFMLLTGDATWSYNNQESLYMIKNGATTGDFNTGYAYYNNGTGSASQQAQSTTFNLMRDFGIFKSAAVNNETVTESSAINVGDVITYTDQVVVPRSGFSYDAMPLVDHMTGGQVLLVPVEPNKTALAGKNLDTTKVGDTTYYILAKEGTYHDIQVGNGIADTIEVGKATDDGLDTMIYWYLEIPNQYDQTLNMDYLALVDPSRAGIKTSEDSFSFSMYNKVWLGDHPYHRIYDDTFLNGSILQIDKDIVTNAEKNITSSHSVSGDTTEKKTTVRNGDRVTYRLAIRNEGTGRLILTGGNLKDVLPGAMGNGWKKSDITVTYIPAAGSTAKISDSSDNAWSVETEKTDSDSSGKVWQKIQWSKDFTIDLQGVLYIYVTLDYPKRTEAEWADYCQLYSSGLENEWKVYHLVAVVYHDLYVTSNILLQKGVYGTGSTYGTGVNYYSWNSEEDARRYYINQSGTKGDLTGLVGYYFVLYNDGPSRMYLSPVQDVLPKGFTYKGLMKTQDTDYGNIGSNIEMGVTGMPGTEKDPVRQIASVTSKTNSTVQYMAASIKTSESENASGRKVVTFQLSQYSDERYSIAYDKDRDQCYLLPGQAVVVGYTCAVGKYEDTQTAAQNIVSMPYTDYNGAGINVTESAEVTVADNPAVTSDQETNDGDCTLATTGDVNLMGLDTTGMESDVKWLTSKVTLHRKTIIPGIKKETTKSNWGTADTVPWTIEATNDGGNAMVDYTLSDVMMKPYQFTGKVSYKLEDGAGNVLADYDLFEFQNRSPDDDTVTLLNLQDKTTVTLDVGGVYDRLNTSSIGPVLVSIRRDQSGNEELTLRFPSQSALIPAGGKATLSLQTKNLGSVFENKNYVNRCYITPTQEFSTSSVSRGNCVSYDINGDNVEETFPSVVSEAQISVNYGYSTAAEKRVTELADKTNTHSSNDTTNYILLPEQESVFRYDMTVTNNGSTTSGDQNNAMSKFVLLDNLPEVGDHTTFYEDYPRYSEFQVDFAKKDKLDFQVSIKNGTTTTTLRSDQYTFQFSKDTDLDYEGDKKKIWNGDALSAGDGWYTLDELDDDTLQQMRTLRVVINDPSETLMPKGAVITVSFSAEADSGSIPAYSKIAWNNFGYLYTVGSKTLRAAPLKVGVKMPGTLELEKKLTYEDGSDYAAQQNETFRFLIYEGNKLDIPQKAAEDKIQKILQDAGRKFTIADVTVPYGESVSPTVSLDEQLKRFEVSGSGWSQTSEDWTWKDSQKYTLYELPQSGGGYSFDSINEDHPNNYTFTYHSHESQLLEVENIRKSWDIQVIKTNETKKAYLPDAVFGIYSRNAADAISSHEFYKKLEELDITAKSSLTVNNETWYLMDIAATNSYGGISWEHLLRDQYYIMELKAPKGYALPENTGQFVSATESGEGIQDVSVINTTDYTLPSSGGVGKGIYTWSGVLLILGSILLYRRSRQQRYAGFRKTNAWQKKG